MDARVIETLQAITAGIGASVYMSTGDERRTNEAAIRSAIEALITQLGGEADLANSAPPALSLSYALALALQQQA